MSRSSLFIRIAQLLFFLAGIILILAPIDWPQYYRPIPMGFMAIAYSFIIDLPRRFFKESSSKLAQEFQIILIINLLLCSLGSLGLWSTTFLKVIDYDKLVHFFFSASILFIGSLALSSKYKYSIKKTVIITVIIIVFFGVAWEFIEYFFATYFHVGYFGTLFDHDSRFDLITNLSGIITGVFFLALRYRFST